MHYRQNDLAALRPPYLIHRLKQTQPDYALAIDGQDQVSGLESGGLGRTSVNRSDYLELAIQPHIHSGANALERAVEVLILHLEHLGRDVTRMWIIQRGDKAPDGRLGERFGIELAPVHVLLSEHLPHLPHCRKLLRHALRNIERA